MATPGGSAPALAPPPGVQPDFEHPASLATIADATVGVCIGVSTAFFFARTWVRLIIKRTWIFEDWCALVAWAGTVGYCSTIAVTMANHGGQHLWDITVAESKIAAFWFSVATIVYGFTIPFTKLTILWLYRRVFVSSRWSALDICIVALAVIQGCFYVATTMIKIFQCSPRDKIWDKSVQGTCIDTSTILNASGIFNVISDFLILILPIYTICRLHMETKKKALVLLVFTFGLCAPAFSVAGLAQRLRTSAALDSTWNLPGIQFWGAAELTTGLMCFCLPELGILFRNKVQHQSGTSHYYRSSQYQKSGGALGSNRMSRPQSAYNKRGSQVLRSGDHPSVRAPYVEIRHGQQSYDIRASKPPGDPVDHELNNVTVRKEVIIEVEEPPGTAR